MKIVSLIGLAFGFLCSVPYAEEGDQQGTVPIAGGSFLMGTKRANIPTLKSRYRVDFPGVFENETPAHHVTVSNFRIDRYEVTNAQFWEFVEQVPEWRKEQLDASEHNGEYLADWHDGHYPESSARLPVGFVTWSAAQSYCRWRGGRLPTEAEWEYVARSGDDREFPWGDELPTSDLANFYASGHGERIEVGSYPPGVLGVYDLAGNVWEFLLDEWVPGYLADTQQDPIAGGPVADEQIPSIEGRRSVRGASFGGSIVNLRTRWRDSHVVTNATEFVGFRCAYPESQHSE